MFLDPMIDGKKNPMRQRLSAMLNGTITDPVQIDNIFPKFLKVTNQRKAALVRQLMGDLSKCSLYRAYSRNVLMWCGGSYTVLI